jgi:hypothetical protein
MAVEKTPGIAGAVTQDATTAASFGSSAATDAGMSAAQAGIQAQSNAGFLQNEELGVQMNLQNQKNEVMEGAIMGIAKAQL